MPDDHDRTASLMSPAKLAQVKPKAAASPAAWLDQMAADAGHPNVRRLAELCEQIARQAGAQDFQPVIQHVQQLADALPALDFNLLQTKGWWARTTGKSKTAGSEFAAQFDRIDECARQAATASGATQKAQQEQAGSGERLLVETDVEVRAIEKIIDQGARWLQDMRNQLKARHAQATDAQSQQAVKDDAARCEILVVRLKLLRGVSSAAQEAHQQAAAVAARRSALVQMLQQQLATRIKEWHARLATVASSAGDASAPALSLEGPMECHRELQLAVKQALADCQQLQAQDTGLRTSLDLLRTQLAAAG